MHALTHTVLYIRPSNSCHFDCCNSERICGGRLMRLESPACWTLRWACKRRTTGFKESSILCTFRTGGYRRRYICRVGSPLDNDMCLCRCVCAWESARHSCVAKAVCALVLYVHVQWHWGHARCSCVHRSVSGVRCVGCYTDTWKHAVVI